MRTTLYFGLARPSGAVTEAQWQVVAGYKKKFQQESVLWESARGAAFWLTSTGSPMAASKSTS